MKKVSNIPQHIAVIMDGNGRWAKKRSLPRIFGHREGAKRVKELVREALEIKVKMLTIFAFSTENWNRPKREIESLFSYLEVFLDKYKPELMERSIKVNVIGRRDRLPARIYNKIEEIENLTKNNKDFTVNIALDYGGRWDILQGVKKLLSDWKEQQFSEESLTEEFFERYLCLRGLAYPDLLIRTSGEQRISNFLLWDLAYTEFYFSEIFWPDFDARQFKKAIETYSKRERRFGHAQ